MFIKNIQQAAWNNTPETTRKISGNNYPKEIRELISEKRKLRKTWQQTRLPRDKTKFNNISRRLKRRIKQIKNESVNYLSIEEGWDMSSDHSPILLTLCENIIQMQISPHLVNRKTDWKSKKKTLKKKFNFQFY